MAADFAHLHVHSEYSLLDGYSPTKQLVKHAAKLGMRSLALTDHGALYGAIEFYGASKDAGVKPIVGVETYMAPGKMTARGAQEREYNHLVLLAQDETGYRNLLQLVSRSWLEGYYYKPRIDRELLAEHSEGLIALSACLGGELAAAILKEDPQAARANASWYREIFGDRYYIELQEHGLKEDKIVTPELVRIGRELDIPLVVTNDNHYTTRDQAGAQDLLLCVQTNSTLDDPKRMRMEPPEFYLVIPRLRARWSSRWSESEALRTSLACPRDRAVPSRIASRSPATSRSGPTSRSPRPSLSCPAGPRPDTRRASRRRHSGCARVDRDPGLRLAVQSADRSPGPRVPRLLRAAAPRRRPGARPRPQSMRLHPQRWAGQCL